MIGIESKGSKEWGFANKYHYSDTPPSVKFKICGSAHMNIYCYYWLTGNEAVVVYKYEPCGFLFQNKSQYIPSHLLASQGVNRDYRLCPWLVLQYRSETEVAHSLTQKYLIIWIPQSYWTVIPFHWIPVFASTFEVLSQHEFSINHLIILKV